MAIEWTLGTLVALADVDQLEWSIGNLVVLADDNFTPPVPPSTRRKQVMVGSI
jgi:hypothetical protein